MQTNGTRLHGDDRVCPGERWGNWPSPVGLTLGILTALAFQVLVIAYHYVRLRWCQTRRIQKDPRPYAFLEGMRSHLANPGGIVMMVAYLCAYWMFDLMPCSYYSFEGGVRWWMVGAQIVSQDLLMFLFHYFEHKGPLGPDFYKASHKPHHRFVNPRLFDAFDGSVPDTFCMILMPLVITSRVRHPRLTRPQSRSPTRPGLPPHLAPSHPAPHLRASPPLRASIDAHAIITRCGTRNVPHGPKGPLGPLGPWSELVRLRAAPHGQCVGVHALRWLLVGVALSDPFRGRPSVGSCFPPPRVGHCG